MTTLTLPATPASVSVLRRHAVGYAETAGSPAEVSQAIALAVSEAVTNAVVHAYRGQEPGNVSVRCLKDRDRIVVEVSDEGSGIVHRPDSPGVGHGLAVVGSLAQSLQVTPRAGGRGTVVTMSFGPSERENPVASLEPLCALALELAADVACVDVVSEGVLRRVAAEVAGDRALTNWLRRAVPPAKPGTATWTALHEGRSHLVVHDPSVARSPGGTGERLGLTWWLAIPVEGPPAALWGMGGREGGRPVPSEAVRADLVRRVQRRTSLSPHMDTD